VLDLARIAYEAYRVSCGSKAVNGDHLPDWEDLDPKIQAHWDAVAQALMVVIR
jgi:hypothetical protein